MAEWMASPPPRPLLPPAAAPLVVKKASLYVGDLHPQVTQLDLAHLFSEIGALDSVRLCRDRVFPYKSLCYAYINFISPIDASKALALLNHTELKGKSMRIMWCQRDPLTRKTGIANLFVKNLHSSVTSARLQTIFSKFGAILSCKVAEENRKSRGFGFVQFVSEESAFAAIAALHDSVLEGKKLYVSKFVKKIEREDYCEGPKLKNLYVKNLDEDVTEDLLWVKFSDYGNICSVTIMKDSEGKSNGFGFVKFESNEEAKKAMEALNGALIGSKKLYVGLAQKKAERAEYLKHACEQMHKSHTQKLNASNLYVKNLNLFIDDGKLEEIFSAFGEVTSAKIMRHDNGFSKGFGFVSFCNPEEAKKALKSLNGTVVDGRSLYVSVAQSKEERSKSLQVTQHQPQSLYTSNWDVLAPPFFPLPLLPTPIPASHIKSSLPNTNQYLGNYKGASYTLGAHIYQGNYSTYIPMRQSQQGTSTIKGWSYKHHPWNAANVTGVHLEMNKSDILKRLKSPNSLAVQVGNAVKVRKVYSLSGADGRVGQAKSARCLRYGSAAYNTSNKMNKSDILKSPNSLAVQVGNANKVREVYSLSGADGRVG